MEREDLLQLHRQYSLTGVAVNLPVPGVGLNRQDENSAMGLPTCTALHCRVDEGAYASLVTLPVRDLARIAEDPDVTYCQRLAAGKLLGLLGDPRINVEAPVMLAIPDGDYELGLKPADVDRVYDEFEQYGVLREWIEKEAPQYRVVLDGVRIAKYPITHSEFRVFAVASGYHRLPSAWRFGVMPEHLSNHPVCTITAEDADAYAAWLSDRTGRKFRLPLEAEWEAAAGGSDGLVYPWGNEYLRDRANTVESGILTSTPVGIFPAGASPVGCLDMAGNVEEYVADVYRPYPGGRQIDDDLLSDQTTYRVARGGSFTRYRDLARCKRRHGWYRSPIYMMGFRLAEDTA